MSGESLLVILLVGLIAGWLAGQIVRGTGFGLIADIALGIVGALIGIWLLPRLGIHVGRGVIALILAATVGAVLLLLVLGLVNRRGLRAGGVAAWGMAVVAIWLMSFLPGFVIPEDYPVPPFLATANLAASICSAI